MQVWSASVPFQSFVGAIANRGQWEQGCSLFIATDLGPVRATRKKKKKKTELFNVELVKKLSKYLPFFICFLSQKFYIIAYIFDA